MSNVGTYERIYISDIYGHNSIGSIHENESYLEYEEWICRCEKWGGVRLLANKSISFDQFRLYNLHLENWDFEIYRTRRYFRGLTSWKALEPLLVRYILSIGRSYAIRRYAQQEKIDFPVAMTAALPYGMQALMSQFLSRQGLLLSTAQSRNIALAWKSIAAMERLTAYGKTGCIKEEIYAIAEQAWGRNGSVRLRRKEMRQILSLTRLHFSIGEMNGGGFVNLTNLALLYEAEKNRYLSMEQTPNFNGILHWQQRHLRPLLFYYPYNLREAVGRGCEQAELDDEPDLEAVTNEAALAQYALYNIRRRFDK